MFSEKWWNLGLAGPKVMVKYKAFWVSVGSFGISGKAVVSFVKVLYVAVLAESHCSAKVDVTMFCVVLSEGQGQQRHQVILDQLMVNFDMVVMLLFLLAQTVKECSFPWSRNLPQHEGQPTYNMSQLPAKGRLCQNNYVKYLTLHSIPFQHLMTSWGQ